MAFLGLDDGVLAAMGRVLAISGRLEGTLRSVAEALASDPGTDQFRTVRSNARRRVAEFGVPPWSRVTAPDLTDWLDRLPDVVSKRDELMHSQVVAQKADTGDMVQLNQHLRSGTTIPIEVNGLMGLVDSAVKLYSLGGQHHCALLPEMRTGVLVPVFGPADRPGAVIDFHATGTWPESRPTLEELDTFWDEFPRRWPPWPAKRIE